MESKLTFNHVGFYCCLTLVGCLSLVHGTFSECPETHRCELRSKGHRLSCSGGLHGEFRYSRSNRVKTLTLCRWPTSEFLPNVIGHLYPELRKLVLIGSYVTHLADFDPDMFHNLEVLNMSRLNIEELPENAFSGLSTLRVLDLRHNRLTHLSPSALPHSLQRLYLSGNPWNCESDLLWLAAENKDSLAHKVLDRNALKCSNLSHEGKPVILIMSLQKMLQKECPKEPFNCTCHINYVAPDPNGVTFQPVTTVNCSGRGLTELPPKLPSITTTLLVKGNQITSLLPLVKNPHYAGVLDIFLDDNRVRSVEVLEGSDWLLNFRVLSLRGNRIVQVPSYALDNALQRNRNAILLYLGNNPWICDCLFTPGFQEFIIKYRKLVKDIDEVRCSVVDGDENSLQQIQLLSRSVVCREPSDYWISPLDLLNVVLASLIVLVIGKLLYDYWSFKTTGKVPWIVTKMP